SSSAESTPPTDTREKKIAQNTNKGICSLEQQQRIHSLQTSQVAPPSSIYGMLILSQNKLKSISSLPNGWADSLQPQLAELFQAAQGVWDTYRAELFYAAR
ncbi:hypothetical protein A6R68_05437, partial [Neotoma lepida]